jgi:thiol:disulfide interchange protein DsbA
MTPRLALLSLILLPLMACSRQDAAAPAAADPAASPAPATDAPAETPAATDPATPAADASATPAAPADAAAPPATPAPAATDNLVEGTDYVEIKNGQPFAPRDGKIEVVEIFGYVCPACAAFQPLVVSWKAKLAPDVRFTYVPAMFGGPWDNYARAFYAAQSMGVAEKTHEAMYQAIHIDQTLKGERGMDTPEDIAKFYAKYGVDPKAFVSTMASFAVAGKTGKAKQFAIDVQLGGTPTLVVDGKYVVKGKDREDSLRIADQLIARERAAAK